MVTARNDGYRIWNKLGKPEEICDSAVTRARTIIANANKCVDRIARRYCAAHVALSSLDPTGSWKDKYQELNLQTDVRGPGKDPHEALAGDGNYTSSWIWTVVLGKSFQDSVARPAHPTISNPTEPTAPAEP